MLLLALVFSLLVSAASQQVDDDWLDPYDMLNYDASSKSMRKNTEPSTYDNVVTKRREYIQDPNQAELTSCNKQVVDQQRQVEALQKTIKLLSHQPTCNPVFKRFLSRLLKEIQRVGVPNDSTDIFYDAKIKLSIQAMTEIQTLLEGEERWRTGALDNAISQILVDLKPHNYEAWKWRFEDTFFVDLDTLLKMGMGVLIIVAIIGTELWSRVSWFVQFKRLFAVCFLVSIVWNWFYLYMIAFAEHQNKIVKMEGFNDKCTGLKKLEWTDSLKEWYRSTWTLQDDPCKEYYENLMVNPIVRVPPTKAISLTITTFITEPLKHFGQGISEFLRALLKDLPVTLQIPVLLTIVLSILVFMYGSVQAAFQHGIMAPLRGPRRDPPHPELEHQQRDLPRIADRGHLAGGDAPAPAPAPTPAPAPAPPHRDNDARSRRTQVRQRRPNRTREEPRRVFVETVGSANPQYSEDEIDAQQPERRPEAEPNLSAESDSENQQETEEEQLEQASVRSVAADTNQTKTKPTQSKNKSSNGNKNFSQDESSRDGAAPKPQPAERQPSQPDVQGLEASAEDKTPSISLTHVETVGVPVQETCPSSAE